MRKEKHFMYRKGEFVVYRHDVCIIKDIKENKLMGNTYYVMTPVDDDSLTIDIPVENKMGFLRDIISADNAKKLIEKIPKINPIKEINEKNQSNSPLTICCLHPLCSKEQPSTQAANSRNGHFTTICRHS